MALFNYLCVCVCTSALMCACVFVCVNACVPQCSCGSQPSGIHSLLPPCGTWELSSDHHFWMPVPLSWSELFYCHLFCCLFVSWLQLRQRLQSEDNRAVTVISPFVSPKLGFRQCLPVHCFGLNCKTLVSGREPNGCQKGVIKRALTHSHNGNSWSPKKEREHFHALV